MQAKRVLGLLGQFHSFLPRFCDISAGSEGFRRNIKSAFASQDSSMAGSAGRRHAPVLYDVPHDMGVTRHPTQVDPGSCECLS
jgi:hypothetical protein